MSVPGRNGAAAILTAAVLLAGGCESPTPTATATAIGAASTPVATPLPGEGCADQVDGHFWVRMSPDDPWLVWWDFPGIGRIDVYWPIGFGVRFEPFAEVVDADGRTIFSDGDYVERVAVCTSGHGTYRFVRRLDR